MHVLPCYLMSDVDGQRGRERELGIGRGWKMGEGKKETIFDCFISLSKDLTFYRV